MPATEKQVESNRRNAARSTGPKTTEGKAASRHNSLKHGLRSASTAPVGDEDPVEVDAMLQAWRDDLRPAGPVEEALVAAAAGAARALKRCRKAEDAAIDERLDRIEEDRFVELQRLADDLPNRPAAVVAALKRTPEGCRWLIDRAEQLLDMLDREVWSVDRFMLLVNLLGRKPVELLDDPEVRELVRFTIAPVCFDRKEQVYHSGWGHRFLAFRPPVLEPDEFLIRLDRITSDRPDFPEAIRRLADRVEALLEEFRGHLEAAEARAEERDRRAEDLAQVDVSAAGSLRMRYFGMHERTLRGSLRELASLRKARAEAGDPAPSEPDLAAPSEANPPAPSEANPVEGEPAGGGARSGTGRRSEGDRHDPAHDEG